MGASEFDAARQPFAEAIAEREFWLTTPVAHYWVSGAAAAGASFSLERRNVARTGFDLSGSALTLPASGSYQVRLKGYVRSAGSSARKKNEAGSGKWDAVDVIEALVRRGRILLGA
jgi:hypothetical protein